MGKASRDKGARGENEVVKLGNGLGLNLIRTAQLQCGNSGIGDVQICENPFIHLEVKRNERMSVDAMVRQAVGDCGEGSQPCVAWRRNRGPWRADIPLTFFLQLVQKGHELENR
jgi:hypothetical protein